MYPPPKIFTLKQKILKGFKAVIGFPFYTYKIYSHLKSLEPQLHSYYEQTTTQIGTMRNEIKHSNVIGDTILLMYQKLLLFRQLGGVNESDFLHKAWAYCSQYNQDVLVDTLLKQKKDGFFIELGAAHAREISNTYFFEEYRNWKGLLIEAQPDFIQDLQAVRKNSIIEQCAVSSEEGELVFCAASVLGGIPKYFTEFDKTKMDLGKELQDFPEIKVPAYKLQTLLDKHQITEVDYLSLDTEGNELDVLQSIDYEKVVIKIMTVEISYPERFYPIYHFLREKSYRLYGKIKVGFVREEDLNMVYNNLKETCYLESNSWDLKYGWDGADFVFLHQSFIL